MNLPRLFRILSFFVFIQIALGGLVTFGIISVSVNSFDLVTLIHIINGLIVLGLALVVTMQAVQSKPSHKGLNEVSMALLIFVVVQIGIGFTLVGVVDSVYLAWVHLLMAVLIYAMTLVGRSFAMLRDQAAGLVK